VVRAEAVSIAFTLAGEGKEKLSSARTLCTAVVNNLTRPGGKQIHNHHQTHSHELYYGQNFINCSPVVIAAIVQVLRSALCSKNAPLRLSRVLNAASVGFI